MHFTKRNNCKEIPNVLVENFHGKMPICAHTSFGNQPWIVHCKSIDTRSPSIHANSWNFHHLIHTNHEHCVGHTHTQTWIASTLIVSLNNEYLEQCMYRRRLCRFHSFIISIRGNWTTKNKYLNSITIHFRCPFIFYFVWHAIAIVHWITLKITATAHRTSITNTNQATAQKITRNKTRMKTTTKNATDVT